MEIKIKNLFEFLGLRNKKVFLPKKVLMIFANRSRDNGID